MQVVRSEKSSSLRRRLDKHFVACAAAATAGIGGAVDQSWAAIQYSGTQNVSVNTIGYRGWYLNFETGAQTNSNVAGPPGWDINIASWRQEYPANSGYFFPYVLSYTTGPTNRIMGSALKAANLSAGANISAAGPFAAIQTGGYTLGFMTYGNPNVYGNFPAGTTGFLGVQFPTADNSLHYAWVRVHINAATGPNGPETSRYPVTVIDWAWETTPNTPIAAGAGVPEPTTAAALGLLAIGSLGSRAWRKRSV